MMMKMMGGCCFCLFRDENIRRDIEDGLGRGGSRRRSGGFRQGGHPLLVYFRLGGRGGGVGTLWYSALG